MGRDKSLAETVRELEEWARRESSRLAGFVEESERLAITYTGLGIIPARIFSSYLYVLSPNKNILSGCIDTVTYHIAPYTEDTSVVLFSEKGVENSIVRLMDTVYYTGNKLLMVSPKPAEYVERRQRNTVFIETPYDNTVLAETLLAVQAGYRIALRYRESGDRELRFNRLRIELADFSSIIGELASIYSAELASIKAGMDKIDAIIYTPTMEPVAYLLQMVVAERTGRIIPVIDVTRTIRVFDERLTRNQLYVLASTTVEEYSVRELLFKARMNRSQVIELKIKTDPLTAPVYGLFIVEILRANNI